MTEPVAGYIPVGYVRRAHGIKGSVVVRPLTDAPKLRYHAGALLTMDGDPSRVLTVATVGPHNDGLLVSFVGVTDRDAADALRGVSLQIRQSDRRSLDEGEFWSEDLVGLTAMTSEGRALGTVTDVVAGAAQDRIVIDPGGGGLVEVPFVDALVGDVLLDEGRVVIDPPQGLF